MNIVTYVGVVGDTEYNHGNPTEKLNIGQFDRWMSKEILEKQIKEDITLYLNRLSNTLGDDRKSMKRLEMFRQKHPDVAAWMQWICDNAHSFAVSGLGEFAMGVRHGKFHVPMDGDDQTTKLYSVLELDFRENKTTKNGEVDFKLTIAVSDDNPSETSIFVKNFTLYLFPNVNSAFEKIKP